MVAAANENFNDPNMEEDDEGKCELDSHANMVVMGKHCTIIEDTGNAAQVYTGLQGLE